mmetsp:Transcript_45232/g.104891  ORF Transcript_45232/g.104891 Transcript_45232/m.104891 type:complete len:270 (-) Transcript_45232:301-1110(-)
MWGRRAMLCLASFMVRATWTTCLALLSLMSTPSPMQTQAQRRGKGVLLALKQLLHPAGRPLQDGMCQSRVPHRRLPNLRALCSCSSSVRRRSSNNSSRPSNNNSSSNDSSRSRRAPDNLHTSWHRSQSLLAALGLQRVMARGGSNREPATKALHPKKSDKNLAGREPKQRVEEEGQLKAAAEVRTSGEADKKVGAERVPAARRTEALHRLLVVLRFLYLSIQLAQAMGGKNRTVAIKDAIQVEKALEPMVRVVIHRTKVVYRLVDILRQ